MAVEIAFYKVVEDIAIRSGLILERYRTVDMNWILDNKDLGRVRFTPDEYIDGLKGVEKISGEEADALIAENGYKMGYEGLVDERNGDVENNDNTEEQAVVDNGGEQTENVDDESFNVEENAETQHDGEQNVLENDEMGTHDVESEQETIENGDVENVEDILSDGEKENSVEQNQEEE